MKPSFVKKHPVSYIAYLWGCKTIVPKVILMCSQKEIILENLQVITRSLNLELTSPNRDDVLNLNRDSSEGPANFYEGRAWDVRLTSDEFQELAKDYYPEHAKHRCIADTGQGVTIFAYRIRDLINPHTFEISIYKYIR